MLTITRLKRFEGQWRSETLETLPNEASGDSILWVDAQDPTAVEVEQLQNYFELENLDLSELSEAGRRSRIEENQDLMSCFVSFPSRDHFLADSKNDWISLYACKDWVVSIHKGYSSITCEIFRKISTHGYSSLSAAPTADILSYIFLDLVTNECYHVSDMVHDRLQGISQEAAGAFRRKPRESNRKLSLDIANARDQVLALRQSVGPLRELVGRAARGEFAVISSSTLPRFEDLYDRAISLIEVVDTHREEIHDIGDILINVQTLTTNNIIRVLTIISAIFLPLTLIAGIYGTNFAKGFFEPGSNSAIGFYGMIASMAIIAVGLISVFRRKGWL